MMKSIMVGVFAVAFLTGCGSGSSIQKSLSQKENEAGIEHLDSSGCNSRKSPFGGGSGKDTNPFLICTQRPN